MNGAKTSASSPSRFFRVSPSGRGIRYGLPRGLLEMSLRLAFLGRWPVAFGRMSAATQRLGRIDVRRAVLPAGSPPLRAAFLSDLHLGPTTPHRLLERTFAAVAEHAPDVLLLGGDYVYLDARAAELRRLERWIRDTAVPRVFAVLGNHDLWSNDRSIRAALEDAGVEVLVNEVRRLDGPHTTVRIVGLDDPWAGEPDPRCADDAAASDVTLLLCHSPEILPRLENVPADVVLCGHTHGGQIDVPRGRPLGYQEPVGRSFLAGRYDLGDRVVLVSKGVGTVMLPFRFRAEPDWIALELVAREDPGPQGAARGGERAATDDRP